MNANFPPATADSAQPMKPHRCGAVGVIVHDDGRLLVIERSQTVRAPGRFCFPGGGIESGETEEAAVKRELAEELNVQVTPIRRLWQSETQSGVILFWWLIAMSPEQQPHPNPAEVAQWFWMTQEEIAKRRETLHTNIQFLQAIKAGAVQLV